MLCRYATTPCHPAHHPPDRPTACHTRTLTTPRPPWTACFYPIPTCHTYQQHPCKAPLQLTCPLVEWQTTSGAAWLPSSPGSPPDPALRNHGFLSSPVPRLPPGLWKLARSRAAAINYLMRPLATPPLTLLAPTRCPGPGLAVPKLHDVFIESPTTPLAREQGERASAAAAAWPHPGGAGGLTSLPARSGLPAPCRRIRSFQQLIWMRLGRVGARS